MEAAIQFQKKQKDLNFKKPFKPKFPATSKTSRSPILKRNPLKSRSQSRTAPKKFPKNDISFNKYSRNHPNLATFSTRFIGLRSKTPNLCRLRTPNKGAPFGKCRQLKLKKSSDVKGFSIRRNKEEKSSSFIMKKTSEGFREEEYGKKKNPDFYPK